MVGRTPVGALALLLLLLGGCDAVQAARRVNAWVVTSMLNNTIAQLKNESWNGIIDGLYPLFGTNWHVEGGKASVVLDEKGYAQYSDLLSLAKLKGIAISAFIGGRIPQEAIEDPQGVARSAVALALQHGWAGYNLDDESECAPRGTLRNFTVWNSFISAFATELHVHNLTLSADVQAMFGVQDAPYRHSAPCKKAPWDYPPEPRVTAMMRGNAIDRWTEMDTYYFTTERFLNALDWYSNSVGPSKLEVGLEVREDLKDPDDYVPRFYAMWMRGVEQVSFWTAPISDPWLRWLYRWKTRCAQCPNNSTLACFEPSAPCGEPS